MGKYQKNIEAARRISVMQYLETYHPGELVRKTDKEYCTKTHSSLVITPANGLFHWFSQSKGVQIRQPSKAPYQSPAGY